MNPFTVVKTTARAAQLRSKTRASVIEGQPLYVIQHTSGQVFYYAYTTKDAAEHVTSRWTESPPNLEANFHDQYGVVTAFVAPGKLDSVTAKYQGGRPRR